MSTTHTDNNLLILRKAEGLHSPVIKKSLVANSGYFFINPTRASKLSDAVVKSVALQLHPSIPTHSSQSSFPNADRPWPEATGNGVFNLVQSSSTAACSLT